MVGHLALKTLLFNLSCLSPWLHATMSTFQDIERPFLFFLLRFKHHLVLKNIHELALSVFLLKLFKDIGNI
jgi:hypothetical protein